MELTPAHLQRLNDLVSAGFAIVNLPLFPNTVGVRKYDCAALLQPVANGTWRVAAQPGLLIEGNISVLVERGGEQWFVWKSHQVRATAERLGALRRFEEELRRRLEPPVV